MSKVVVTGGAGFIGSHLVKELKNLGHQVEIIDIALDPKRDVRSLEGIKKFFIGAEYVFHMAAIPSVPFSIEYPAETNETNLTGTLNVLIAAREAGVKRVIFSSSCAIYGDQEKLPIKETATVNPMSPYATQKLMSEQYLKLFADIYDLETVSLRYFNVYGAGQDPKGPYAAAISKFLVQKKAGQPITLIGDGSQTRDFVHVSDVVRANLAAMESSSVGNGEVVNIGSGEKVSIKKIAEIIGGPIEHLPPRLEIKDSLGDVSLAKQLLNWVPQVKLEEGIRALLK